MFAFILMSCAQISNAPDADMETGADSLEYREHIGACLPGVWTSHDIGAEPYALSVELRYIQDVYIEVPFIRTGTVIEIKCGERDDAANGQPQVDGEWAGPIVGYRASWLAMTP